MISQSTLLQTAIKNTNDLKTKPGLRRGVLGLTGVKRSLGRGDGRHIETRLPARDIPAPSFTTPEYPRTPLTEPGLNLKINPIPPNPSSLLDTFTSSDGLSSQPKIIEQVPDHRYVAIFCSNCGYKHYILMYCGDKTCIECRKRIYGQLINKLWDTLGQTKQLRFLTLTLRNIDYMRRTDIDRLRSSWKKLYSLKAIKSRMKGGVYVIEITNTGKGWHLHLHIVYDGDFIPQSYLSQQWRRITGDSFIVHITKMVNRRSTIAYISKYLVKTVILDTDKQIYNIVLEDVKLVNCFGYWYKIKRHKKSVPCPICKVTAWISAFNLFDISAYRDMIDDGPDPPDPGIFQEVVSCLDEQLDFIYLTPNIQSSCSTN